MKDWEMRSIHCDNTYYINLYFIILYEQKKCIPKLYLLNVLSIFLFHLAIIILQLHK